MKTYTCTFCNKETGSNAIWWMQGKYHSLCIRKVDMMNVLINFNLQIQKAKEVYKKW